MPAHLCPPVRQDIQVENHVSIFLFRPLTKAAQEWFCLHCPPGDNHQYFGNALVVEHRYASDLIRLARNDGLTA